MSFDAEEPTWHTVKGILTHRCALAAAGKWLWIGSAKENWRGEPCFVAEARWVAQQLAYGFEGYQYLAWALVDSGGPHWSRAYDDFMGLSEDDQHRVLEGNRDSPPEEDENLSLEELSVRVAQELLAEAERDKWQFLLSEIFNPFRFLDARTGNTRFLARKRMDLLVQRSKNQIPLIVDLKTGQRERTANYLAQEVDELRRLHTYLQRMHTMDVLSAEFLLCPSAAMSSGVIALSRHPGKAAILVTTGSLVRRIVRGNELINGTINGGLSKVSQAYRQARSGPFSAEAMAHSSVALAVQCGAWYLYLSQATRHPATRAIILMYSLGAGLMIA